MLNHCTQGAAPSQCSPFYPVVAPGPTVPALSEAESPSTEVLDYLAEAVAGHFAIVYIQAKVTDSFTPPILSSSDFSRRTPWCLR